MGENVVFQKMPQNSVIGSRQTVENNEFLLKYHCNALDSPNCFVPSTMPWRIYSKDNWFSKYGLYAQPCHRGFIVKITDSPNMVCTVHHAMEDLQHRILHYCLLHCNVKMERAREREEDSDGRGNSTEREERNRRATYALLFSNYCTCNSLLSLSA